MNQPESPDRESPGTSLKRAVEAVTDIATGIPAPIRKNALKAFGRLCTAAIDIPIAALEGKAAEIRAESHARVRLIESSSESIASQIQVPPEYARAAVRKFGERIVREHVNLDRIATAAAEQLRSADSRSEADPTVPPTESAALSDDWLNVFEKEASQKSSEELQLAYSRILAGEIRKPSTFSIKTLRLLGQLDGHVAALFQRLCSLACALRVNGSVVDARVIAFGGSAAANALAVHGLSFGILNTLHEYGLIIPDYNSYMDYRLAVVHGQSVAATFEYSGSTWALTPDPDYAQDQSLPIHGVALSRSGVELLGVVERVTDAAYTEALVGFFRSKKLTMTTLKGA